MARAEIPADPASAAPGGPGAPAAPAGPARLAIVAMGKCGARELNYASDVDVIFVAEPADEQTSEEEALTMATKLAAGMIRVCERSTPEGAIFPVDPNLRPEGRQGPLVRTLASHLAYYDRWAKTWEFQALLKARPAAGDRELGNRYAKAVAPLVWQAAQRENFVEDVQAMRRRVVATLPRNIGCSLAPPCAAATSFPRRSSLASRPPPDSTPSRRSAFAALVPRLPVQTTVRPHPAVPRRLHRHLLRLRAGRRVRGRRRRHAPVSAT